MKEYRVGKIIDRFVNHQEGALFDISDGGANLIIFFRHPTKEEIEQFNNEFEIRFTEICGVIMMTFKIGNLQWMDAPYSPHLSKHLTTLNIPAENQGLGVTLFLVDAITGEIKSMRLMGLSNDFTKKLFDLVMQHQTKEFNIREYSNSINRIYATYPTDKIVHMSNNSCKIN